MGFQCRKIISLFLFTIIFISCKSNFIKRKLTNSEILKHSYTGFSLFDLTANKTVTNINTEKYFQPASNMKLFTFYAGLKILGDSVPALKYIINGDSLIFWGTGDPSLLHPDLPKSNTINFLKNRSEKLYFSAANNFQKTTGNGWMIDDYNDHYQAEINSLPIYGNTIRFFTKNNKLESFPEFSFVTDSAGAHGKKIIRDYNANDFSFPHDSLPDHFYQEIPFKTSSNEISSFLQTEINKGNFNKYKYLETINKKLPEKYSTLYSIKSDSLYKRMLLVSDNMIAEQIILLASESDTFNTSKSIENILKTHLADLPDKPRWVDGSGLSRYNLTTPRSLVYILKKIYEEFPKERIYDLMPKNNEDIYAKSGSFSNNYNLSGYLIGKSGKTYAFSFMNNNFMIPTKEIRKEVEQILNKLQRKL